MNSTTWANLTENERATQRDNSGLTAQLCGLEGFRVEVVTSYGEKRRFIVGKSTGWKPCHLELNNRRSSGGGSAEKSYASVTQLYKAR